MLALGAIGAGLGWLVGHAGWGAAIGVALFAFWQLRQLLRMQRWLLSRHMHPPESTGTWQTVFDALERRRKLDRHRRKRLLISLEAFRDAAAALPDGLIAIDEDNTIHWFNRSAKRLLGLRYPMDIGQRLDHLLRSPVFVRWLGEGRLDEPLIDQPAPENERMRLLYRLIAYRPGLRMLIVRDVSNLMRLEQVRRDFVANVSHELRTPLTVINGYLGEIEPDELGDLGPLFLEMRRQSSRMAHIVEDLLTLSRLEAQSAPNDEPVAICPMLARVARDAEALSQGQHAIHLDCQAGLDLVGSGKDLHSAFSNLVVNAVRYTPAGGHIRLAYAAHPEGVAFSVADTGQGIPAQHIPRLTERFYRVSNSRSRETGGTGLGLAIVKHVLSAHGARLEIESTVGKGSTFRCVFPSARVRQTLDADQLVK
jgi:two-component system phosphate regulon sensor histidine kinase PhoR